MIYLVTKQTQLFDTEYKLLSLEEAFNKINSWKCVQYDSETTGLDPHLSSILCMQFGNKAAGEQIVVDTTTISPLAFKEILETKFIIGQNLKFDLQFLYNHGIVPRKVYDTMIVEQLLYLGYPSIYSDSERGISYSLNAIAERRLNINIDKSIRGQIIWRGLDSQVIKYAAGDVQYLEDIMWLQLEDCKSKECLVGAKLECDFVPVIAYLEWCGIRLNVDRWNKKTAQYKKDLEEAIDKLNKWSVTLGNEKFYKINRQGDLFEGFDLEPKCTINWGSSKQVIEFAKYLGFDTKVADKKTGKDKDSVLENHLKRQKGVNDEFLKYYFDLQEKRKVVSTYGDNYVKAINPKTDRIHTVFRQLSTTSGRLSCGDSSHPNVELARYKGLPPNEVGYPQLQNLPGDQETRACFIPKEGNIMASVDYSAMESRLGADIYDDKSMIEEFLYGSGDIHSLVAKHCFPELKDVPVKEIKDKFPHLRKKAKPIGFASQFGGTAYAIMNNLGCSFEEAQRISDYYNKGFKGIAKFKKKGSIFLKNNGYIVICAKTGHKLYWHDWEEWKKRQDNYNSEFWEKYRDIKEHFGKDHPIVQQVSNDFKVVSKYERLALNSPTQGTGAIICKEAATKFFKWILENNLFGVVLLCNMVHDEIVIEYPKHLSETSSVLKKIMEIAADDYCEKLPIPAEASVGDHWIH